MLKPPQGSAFTGQNAAHNRQISAVDCPSRNGGSDGDAGEGRAAARLLSAQSPASLSRNIASAA